MHHKVSLHVSGSVAVRASGWFTIDGRCLWGQFSNYVVNVGNVGGLIEQSVLVGAERRPRLAREVDTLTQTVDRSLTASLSAYERRKDAHKDPG